MLRRRGLLVVRRSVDLPVRLSLSQFEYGERSDSGK